MPEKTEPTFTRPVPTEKRQSVRLGSRPRLLVGADDHLRVIGTDHDVA